MGWHDMDVDMDMNMDMLLTETCCKYCFLVKKKEKKKQDTTDVGSHCYALHQCFFPLPPPLPPQKHD